MRWIELLVAFSLEIVACGGSPTSAPVAPKPPPTNIRNTDEMYPTPYTADEIRDASPKGRRIEWHVEKAGAPSARQIFLFVRSTDEGADIESQLVGDDGIVAGSIVHATWDELRQHAAFPRLKVTVHDESKTVPAGTFDCTVYVVDQEDGEVSHFFFAKNHAGPPVFHFTEKDSARITTSTLVSDVVVPPVMP